MFRAISPSKTPFLRSFFQTCSFFSYSALSSSLPRTSTPIFLKAPITNPSLSNPTFTPNSILFSPFSSQSSRQKKAKEEYYDDSDGEFVVNRDPKSPPKLFVVQPRLRPDALLKAKLDEAVNLANSLEEQRDGYAAGDDFAERKMPPHLVVQNPAATKAHADTYFGQGTVETVKSHLNAAETEDGMDAVFVNAILSGIQQRNLERAWGKAVLDRVGLIIEIFNAHAQTKEAKLQAELAALMYRKTRLVRLRGPDGRLTFGVAGEAAEVVSARGRGSGGRGFISGAGETELQLQRRRILERRNHLLAQIEEVRRTRALQRAARKRRAGSHGQGLATVAVVGYTNAGKSTLISALSDSDLYSDDRLFATVDPRLRSVILPSGKKVLLSDTVGFISDLPVQLVEAFHATLEEIVEADLLVHVLDASAFNLEEQRSAVIQVLQQIGVSEEKLQNMIEVWNKIDLLQMEQDEESNFSEAEEHEMVSEALTGEPVEDHTTSELFAAGYEIDKEVEQNESSEDIVIKGENVPNQPQDIQRIETSALMGVGFQELLSLIDEKLNAQKYFESRIFDRKWRPSCTADMNAAVEQ